MLRAWWQAHMDAKRSISLLLSVAGLAVVGIGIAASPVSLAIDNPPYGGGLVGAFIGAFKAMENVFIMTGGGPNYATHVIGLDIWYNAFVYLKYGLAVSMAWE